MSLLSLTKLVCLLYSKDNTPTCTSLSFRDTSLSWPISTFFHFSHRQERISPCIDKQSNTRIDFRSASSWWHPQNSISSSLTPRSPPHWNLQCDFGQTLSQQWRLSTALARQAGGECIRVRKLISKNSITFPILPTLNQHVLRGMKQLRKPITGSR